MTQLWPWQQGAVDFSTAPHQLGTIFDMGMGTGKSLSVIEAAKIRDARRILIVGPKAVVSQNAWGSQFEQHGEDHFKWELLNKGNADKKSGLAALNLTRARAHGLAAVNVINYESLWIKGFAPHALRGQYDMLVLDESHKIKSPTGKASKFAAKLSHQIRMAGGTVLALTGTLMPHSPLDVWAQMRAVAPQVLGGSYFRFKQRYAVMGGWENRKVIRFQHLDELRELMRPYVYKVAASVLQFDAPLISTVTIQMPREAQRAYDSMERDLVADIGDGTITAANGLVKLLRLQQFTSGYARIDESDDVTPFHDGKLDALRGVFEGTMEEPVVVFGQFRGDQETARKAAEAEGRPYFELSGRANDLEDWDAMSRHGVTPAPVLGVQIASGGTGINLTAAGVAVYLSTGFNMGNFDQSMARLNRPGRKPIVRFIHIEAANTIDVRVRHALRGRKSLVEGVLRDLTHQMS